MRNRVKIRSLRGRLLLAVLIAVGLALIALTVAFNVVLQQTLSGDANDLLQTRAAAVLSTLSVTDRQFSVSEAPDDAALDSEIWVFTAAGKVLEHPTGNLRTDRAARSIAGSHERRSVDVADTDTRLLAVPVIKNGTQRGTVVAGISLRSYRRSQRVVLIASIVLALLLLLAVGAAARWVLDAALQPVDRMTKEAADWSEHDLDRRFALGPPHDELTQLAAMLDGLLDRLAASLRREQRFSAELSHELRTPLARISAEAQLALRSEREPDAYREALTVVLGSTEQMGRTLEALVTAARAETAMSGTSDALKPLLDVVESCRNLAQEHGVEIAVLSPPAPTRVGAEADFVERVLAPLIENACRYGNTKVSVSVKRHGANVQYRVEDDGPGTIAEERESIFEPGVRGSAADKSTQRGAGLGLALVRRMVQSVGGTVECEANADGGNFVLTLPSG